MLEGSKYMLLNLASIYGTKVKELIRPQITPFSKYYYHYSKDMYTDTGIAIQVKDIPEIID